MLRDVETWWGSTEFLSALDAWATTELASRGIGTTGPAVAHRVRFWSAVFRVPTEARTYWIKVASPGQGFEVELSVALANLVPDHVLAPVATRVAPADGDYWMLMTDGGTTLREHGAATTGHWCRLVTDAAEMQRRLIHHGPRLRAAGLPALSASHAISYVEQLVAWGRDRPPHDGQHLTEAQADLLLGSRDILRADLQLLDEAGVPDTLQHNDLSDNNAFVSGQNGLGQLRFFDLGDAFWGHPFAALHLTLAFATKRYPWPDLDSGVARAIIDAYLACWSDVAPVAELRGLVVPALRLGLLHRAESWRRLLAVVPPREDSSPTFDLLVPAVSEPGDTMSR